VIHPNTHIRVQLICVGYIVSLLWKKRTEKSGGDHCSALRPGNIKQMEMTGIEEPFNFTWEHPWLIYLCQSLTKHRSNTSSCKQNSTIKMWQNVQRFTNFVLGVNHRLTTQKKGVVNSPGRSGWPVRRAPPPLSRWPLTLDLCVPYRLPGRSAATAAANSALGSGCSPPHSGLQQDTHAPSKRSKHTNA
jgi:hypothetical protein